MTKSGAIVTSSGVSLVPTLISLSISLSLSLPLPLSLAVYIYNIYIYIPICGTVSVLYYDVHDDARDDGDVGVLFLCAAMPPRRSSTPATPTTITRNMTSHRRCRNMCTSSQDCCAGFRYPWVLREQHSFESMQPSQHKSAQAVQSFHAKSVARLGNATHHTFVVSARRLEVATQQLASTQGRLQAMWKLV